MGWWNKMAQALNKIEAAKLKLCPICETCELEEMQEMAPVTYKGINGVVPLVFSTCKDCGEQANSQQMLDNKNFMTEFKQYIDKE